MSGLQLSLQATDWLHLFIHYLSLSLLSLGGALATAPEMHRYLVAEQNWLTDPQFSSSITIAQAAPGPNILFVALMGWNIGMNAGGMTQGLLGMAVCMVGHPVAEHGVQLCGDPLGTSQSKSARSARLQAGDGADSGGTGICDRLDTRQCQRHASPRLALVVADARRPGADAENPHTHSVAAGRRGAAGIFRPGITVTA
jgi:hypothetical protein